jgi:hypothetical protein
MAAFRLHGGRRQKFMEDLLIAILQGLFEFIIEVLGYNSLNWPFDWKWPESSAGKCCLWFIAGCGLAGISVLVLKHTWITHPALRIANLVVAPLTSAFISQAIALRRSRRHPSIVPRNHFWQAFWFTLGVVTVRFAYAMR